MPPRKRISKKNQEPCPEPGPEPEPEPEEVAVIEPAPAQKPVRRKKVVKKADEPLDNSAHVPPAPALEAVVSAPPLADCCPPDDGSHIILQLPISADRVKAIIQEGTEALGVDGGNPCPYVPSHCWTMACSSFETAGANEVAADQPHISMNTSICHWCCHPIVSQKFGMPINFDSVHNIFHVYGQFCSLPCAAAYNASTHMGSDRMWDIHSWIQMMGQVYQHPLPVRPAPSRYVLKMFGGPLSIEEFRASHRTLSRTVVLNVPPLVSVQSQVEWVNTSFLQVDSTDARKLSRKKSIVDSKRTLESKMNLTVTNA